jgi:RNA polymerase sigma-70 factor, ECF subfamily
VPEAATGKASAVVRDQEQEYQSGHREHGLAAETDQNLTARVARGEQAAYSLLVLRHTNMHLSLAQRLMGNREEAEDALQDAFIKLWTNAWQYDAGKAKFSTWFYRIVLNQCLDRKRRKKPVALPEEFEVVDDSAGPDELLSESQAATVVKRQLDQLPERQKAAIVLCYYQGLSNKEAAVIMDIRVKALESLLTRGRKTLAKTLASDAKRLLDI